MKVFQKKKMVEGNSRSRSFLRFTIFLRFHSVVWTLWWTHDFLQRLGSGLKLKKKKLDLILYFFKEKKNDNFVTFFFLKMFSEKIFRSPDFVMTFFWFFVFSFTMTKLCGKPSLFIVILVLTCQCFGIRQVRKHYLIHE